MPERHLYEGWLELGTKRPDRIMDPYAAQFWEFTSGEELRLQRCDACGAMRWPPAAVCDQCLSADYTWAIVTGRARLISWVTFHRQYFPEYPPPHSAITVELEEGPLFVSTVADETVDELSNGMRMELAWVEGSDRFGEFRLPVFRPAV